MRLGLPFILTLLSFSVFGQEVAYRHDSLFLNNYFVDAATSKRVLDSLLQSTGKTKRSKDKFRKNPITGKKVRQTTLFYYDEGLFFRKYDHDSTKMSIGIKLYREVDKSKERRTELKKPFKGKLYIAGNYINDKRQIEQLRNLENCSVVIKRLTFRETSAILGGDLVYMDNLIRLSFDNTTEELTAVFIHYNFKDK